MDIDEVKAAAEEFTKQVEALAGLTFTTPEQRAVFVSLSASWANRVQILTVQECAKEVLSGA
jgi:hypothetical protein